INDAKSNSSIKSVYKGSDIPDTFKPGAEIVIEGTLDASGVFQARKLMPKCPSRYAPG
ncbi:MAG: cytochrome c maturation protein CcmE, partial [Chloroflexi bacterium]|nr:cytochrome c maturation protein CcmE [Chloroflexota bacterium]